MTDEKTPWPSVAVGFETLRPIPLSSECKEKISAAFSRHRKLAKGPRHRLFRAFELALARYQTNKKIRGDSDRDIAQKQIRNLQSAARNLRQKNLESLSMVARIALSKANESSSAYSSLEEMTMAAAQIERAAGNALAMSGDYSHRPQFHAHALVRDIGECLADLTEGGMTVEGDPGVDHPELNARENALLADIYRALLPEREPGAPKYPRRTLRAGLDQLIELRRLERRADPGRPDVFDQEAVAELSPIDRMKDALKRDDEA